jgi:hypothetical protein
MLLISNNVVKGKKENLEKNLDNYIQIVKQPILFLANFGH